jgi:hypothetical protein
MTGLRPIRPTLYVGLGGTGKEVLLRLRRRVCDEFGIPTLPWTRFLYIDCDDSATDRDLRQVDFESRERVALFDSETPAIIGKVLRRPEKYGFIHEWLDDGTMLSCLQEGPFDRYDSQHSVRHGALGIRAIGRLLFFLKFAEIQAALKNALMELCRAETLVQTQHFCGVHHLGDRDTAPPIPPMVHVVSSAAGGTGAGSLIDLTFLLRHFETALQRLTGIASYVFLPSVFAGDRNSPLAMRCYANAYATLKELNHFCLRVPRGCAEQNGEPSIDFHVTWQEEQRLTVMGPPVSLTYLFEMRNSAAVALASANRRELFSMLAGFLFLESTSDVFSSALNSHIDVIMPSLAEGFSTGDEMLRQMFSRRFGAFGLSKLEVPVNTIRAACAVQLGSDVARHILKDAPAHDFTSEAVRDLATAKLDTDGIVDSFGDGWRDTLDGAVDAFFKRQVDGWLSDPQQLTRELGQLQHRLLSFNIEERENSGQVPLLLMGRIEVVVADAMQRADGILRAKCLEHAAWGLTAALRADGYLDTCVQQLTNFISVDIERRCADNQRRIRAFHGWQCGVCVDLAEATLSTSVRLFAASSWTTGVLLDRLREATSERFHSEAQFILCSLAGQVLKRIRDHLDGHRRASLRQLLDSANLYAEECERRATDLRNLAASNDIMSCRLFDTQLDWKGFYRLDGKEDDGVHQPIDASRELALMTSGLGLGGGLIDLAEHLGTHGFREFSGKINAYCENRFRDDFHTNERNVDVLDHRLLRNNREEYLHRLVNAALPWVLREGGESGNTTSHIERFAFLGVANTHETRYIQLGADLARLLQSRTGRRHQIEVGVTDNAAEIVLFTADYGFALPLLPILGRDAHNAYWDLYNAVGGAGEGALNPPSLHLSKRWEGMFEDLVVYPPQHAAILREIASVLLFGHILKVLIIKQHGCYHFYGYMLPHPFSRADFMGPRWRAVACLLRDSKLRSKLSTALAAREAALTPDQMLAYLRAVRALATDEDAIGNYRDDLLLRQKAADLCRFGSGPVQREFDAIDKMEPQPRFEYFRDPEASGLGWVLNSYPVVASLSTWECSV